MKKVTRIIGAICMMALLTVVSTSCKKDQDAAGTEVITAEVETFGVEGERAYIDPEDNYNFWWHPQDYVRVFNLSSVVNEQGFTDESTTSVFYKYNPTGVSKQARFRGPSVGSKKNLGYRLFYPTAMFKYKDAEDQLTADLENGNRATFTVSTHQQFSSYEENGHILSFVDPDAMPLAIDPEKLNGTATFRHMFGVASFGFRAPNGQITVVDSVKLTDKALHITGDVTLKLDRVAVTNEAMGAEHNLLNVQDAFFDAHGWNEPFISALAEELDWLDWCPSNTGYSITMNCRYAKEEGAEPTGVQLMNVNSQTYTYFNFMLRPLALYNGFTIELYIHNDADPTTPIVKTFDSDNNDFGSLSYANAVKRAKIKFFQHLNGVSATN